MAPPKPAYDVDWIFLNTSNYHTANHLGWFTIFERFDTVIDFGFDRSSAAQV